MEKLRILYLGPVPPEVGGTSHGGIATHAWQLATYAAKHGFAVYILANVKSFFDRADVHVIGCPSKAKPLKALTAARSWFTLRKRAAVVLQHTNLKDRLAILYRSRVLEKVIKDVRPDIIHVHSLHNIDTLALGLLQSCPPIVVTDHGFWQGLRAKSDEIRVAKAANLARRIICVSNVSQERVTWFGLASKDKTIVIHNPISPIRIPLLDREHLKKELGYTDKKLVFFSGAVEPLKRKGLDKLLACFARDKELRKTYTLIVLTNHETIEVVRSICTRETIDAIILGPQSWEDVVKFYNAADVFVMPSKSESFGLVYVEAMLAGTPIVGFQPIVKELESLLGTYIGEGFDAEREDEVALSNKIKRVVSRKIDRSALRQRVINKLSWDAMWPQFESLYRQLLVNK